LAEAERTVEDRLREEYFTLRAFASWHFHAARWRKYKPDVRLTGIGEHLGMRERTREVVRALRAFEEQFEALAHQD
jgi:hypothetical protein